MGQSEASIPEFPMIGHSQTLAAWDRRLPSGSRISYQWAAKV